MRSSRLPLVIIIVLAIAAIVRVAGVWQDLPETMASHFDLSGKPDGWMPRGTFFIVLGVVVGGVVALLASTSRWLRWMPSDLINLPNRGYWLVAERREDTIARFSAWMTWFAAATSALFLWILEVVLRTNLGVGHLGTMGFLGGLGAYLGVLALMVVALYRSFRVPANGRGS